MSNWPPEIDAHLVRRVNVATAARYLGRGPRWVQMEIEAGRLPAIDLAPDGAKRAKWAIAIADVWAYVGRAEARAHQRVRAAQERKQRKERRDPAST